MKKKQFKKQEEELKRRAIGAEAEYTSNPGIATYDKLIKAKKELADYLNSKAQNVCFV